MILWLTRCFRADVAYAASALGSRVASWTDKCERELERCVGYIAATQEIELKQSWVKGQQPVVRLYTDSDWRSPKSQTGYALVLESDCNHESYNPEYAKKCKILIAFGSIKQPLQAESVAAAESIAAYTGARRGLPLKWSIDKMFNLF